MSVLDAPPAATPLEQATHARTIQAALSAALAKDVARIWPNLNPGSIDSTFPAWLQQMIQLVNRYRGMSSLAAGIYYRDTRETATGLTTPDALIKHAGDADPDWLKNGFGFSGPGVLQNPKYEPDSALSITQGTASRMVADAGRTTIIDTAKADRKALGWYRVTDGDPCAFCALLASRGAVYKKDSFEESNAQFDGPGIIKVHNDCGCMPGALFTRDQELPEASQAADRIYTEQVSHLPNSQRLAAFRKAWDAHLAAQSA